eukprot:scaffold160_cov188-Alexandrium_tamarense.AAC.10
MRERGLDLDDAAAADDDDGERKQWSQQGEDKVLESLNWKGAKGGVAVVKMATFGCARNLAGGLLVLLAGDIPKRGIAAVSAGVDTGSSVVGGVVAENGATAVNGDATNADDTSNNNTATATNGEPIPPPPEQEPPLPPNQKAAHLETLRQISSMKVYHLYNYNIPTPTPHDMKIPMEEPTPQDPTVPFRLLEALTTIRERYEDSLNSKSGAGGNSSGGGNWGGHALAATGSTNADTTQQLHLDSSKLAAAAGGMYDEDADPLNAEEVKSAVLEFKRSLEDRDLKSRKRRIDVVNERMKKKVAELVKLGRKEREMRRRAAQLGATEAGGAGETDGSVPPPPPPPQTVGDTGRRGVSNLPAWMTRDEGDTADTAVTSTNDAPKETTPAEEEGSKKRKFVPSEANRDINVRKARIDVVGGQSLSEIRAANEAADKAAASTFVAQTTKEGVLSAESHFPPLLSTPSTSPEALKQYVTSKIVDYLGEEESTLIEFIMKELSKEGGCKTTALLEEMKMVLDEDAEEFVLGLYGRMVASPLPEERATYQTLLPQQKEMR